MLAARAAKHTITAYTTALVYNISNSNNNPNIIIYKKLML
jgi:hypothetical protein